MKRQRKKNTAFVASFVIVLGVLTIGTFSLYYLSVQVPVNHLPSKIPQYSPVWGKYVPGDFVQMGLENFSLTRPINSSVPPSNMILQLVKPRINVSSDQVTALLTVTLRVPNATVDVAFLTGPAFDSLNSLLSSQAKYSATLSGITAYFIGTVTSGGGNTTVTFGWLAPVEQDRSIAFAVGYEDAEVAVKAILDTANGYTPSMLSLSDVDKAIYLVGGASNHLAVGFENFPGVARTSNMTAISVDLQGGSILVSNVVGFNSTQTAVSQYRYVKSVYLTYSRFTVYDSFVDVQAIRPLSQLEDSIRLVE